MWSTTHSQLQAEIKTDGGRLMCLGLPIRNAVRIAFFVSDYFARSFQLKQRTLIPKGVSNSV